MKTARHLKILEIIKSKAIETQEELSEALREFGFDITQATISRDIKELRLTKSPAEDGRYRYAAPSDANADYSQERLRTIFRESVISAQAAQNMAVIKTLPGMASGACLALDTMPSLNIVGTLAGDDTAFVVTPDSQAAQHLCQVVQDMLS